MENSKQSPAKKTWVTPQLEQYKKEAFIKSGTNAAGFETAAYKTGS